MPGLGLLGSLAIACGGIACGGSGATSGSGSGGGAGPPELAIVAGAPAPPAMEPAIEPHPIDGYATSLGADGALIAAGTTTSVYAIDTAGPALLPIVGDEPDLPLETGAVRSVAGFEGGLLIAAETALFYTEGDALQLSLASGALHPLGIVAMSSRLADDDEDGAAESHLAMRTDEAAFEIEGGEIVEWKVDGEGGAPTAMLGQKERLYLAFGSRVYEVDRESKKAYPLPFDVGHVREIACSSVACDEGSLVYFASDAGLVERGADGSYTLFPLAAEGAPPVAVETFAFDAGRQRLYALAGDVVLRVSAGELPIAVATLGAPAMPRSAAVDKLGDVWAGEGLVVKKLALGTPLSFETDVKPVVHVYCAGCHATATNGAPKIDFESYDTFVDRVDNVLERVTEGTMPPATYDKKLPKEKIQILQDWSVTKAP